MNSESTHSFLSYDGTKLEGTLRIPPDYNRRIVLLVHGITSSRDELSLFSDLAKHFAEKGVASFRFDYRCHGVNSQPMQTLTLAGIVNDIEAAFFCANELIHPISVHPIGMSFGGGITAYWAATTQIKVESVVLLAPVIDYQLDILGQHGLMGEQRLGKEAISSLLKNCYVEADGIKYGAPLINELPYINGIAGLRALQCRSLIIHGDADSVVPFSVSEKYVKLNNKCELVNIVGTDHGFGVPGDEDLTSPETKARHIEVFTIISRFVLSEE